MTASTGPQATATQEVTHLGRFTQQRALVLEAFIEAVAAEGFASAQARHARLLAADSPVGLSTVYRTLSALAETGRADVVRDMNGERLFRYRPGSDHRHHLLCAECGVSVMLDAVAVAVEEWAAGVARTSGFTAVRHTVELTGICPDCGPSVEGSHGD
ncbi:Fur family transcriptional regulator [Streptomyces sp. NRRL S-337]|uniref:Fur family transcriptional regulator n=1 Tax=Streptomyces sp. NRRL S-337 TaxID=1463900 RepID=UPI0004CBEADE|nr:Fur family transcriptional regulator [Streptomyces sp. NRRL S-337]